MKEKQTHHMFRHNIFDNKYMHACYSKQDAINSPNQKAQHPKPT